MGFNLNDLRENTTTNTEISYEPLSNAGREIFANACHAYLPLVSDSRYVFSNEYKGNTYYALACTNYLLRDSDKENANNHGFTIYNMPCTKKVTDKIDAMFAAWYKDEPDNEELNAKVDLFYNWYGDHTVTQTCGSELLNALSKAWEIKPSRKVDLAIKLWLACKNTERAIQKNHLSDEETDLFLIKVKELKAKEDEAIKIDE